MNSFKKYYNLKEGWRDYMPTVARGYDKVAAKGREVKSKYGTGAYDDVGWDAMKKAGGLAQKVNPYAKGNVIGKAADWMDRTTKRMQGDVSAVDSSEIAAFRQKLGKIYSAPANAAVNPVTGAPSNKITLDVKDILNANLPSPTPTGRKPDGTDIYSPAFTTYQQAIAAVPPQLFDYVNFTATRRGIYKDAHHFANIVLDEMSKFLAGGKYSYKDAAAILYGQPGSKTGKFDPDAIAILDKYGMLYKQ